MRRKRRSMDKLEKQGLVTHERVVQDTRPNKKLYTITDDGRTAFLAWLAEGSGDIDFKSSLLMKLFFSGNLPIEQTIEHLEQFSADCEAFVEDMRQIPQAIEKYSRSAPAADPLFWGLTADFGARYMRMCIEWAQDSIKKLGASQ